MGRERKGVVGRLDDGGERGVANAPNHAFPLQHGRGRGRQWLLTSDSRLGGRARAFMPCLRPRELLTGYPPENTHVRLSKQE